jgi:hypothetical protein
MALGLTQPPVQCVPGPLSPVVRRPECEADFLPTSSADMKNENTHDVCLDSADRDNFTFIFSLFYQFSACLFCALSIDINP